MEERLEKHRGFLVDQIDPKFGLLDKLLANNILTRESLHKIKLKDNTIEDKNRILLDFILKNKKANELISALKDSGQTHLVNYLNSDGSYRFAFGDDWPLSKSDISRLDVNYESLVELLDTSDLCNKLFSEEVINNRQKQLILSKPTDAEKNEALLDMLTRCSIRDYKMTIVCLNNSKQSHIAELLSEGGVVVRVHANIEDAIEGVDEMEAEIISQLTKVLENRPLEEATRLLELTKLGIIATRKGQSIVIYIQCKTHNELLELTDLLKTERLEGIIERVFTEMLSVRDPLKVSLTWSMEEFRRAVKYFESENNSSESPIEGTTSPKEGTEKRSLKFPSSVGKWVQRKFSKKKRALEGAKVTETNPQGITDSDEVSLIGDLQSRLTLTERRSLSTALTEETRHGDIKRWLLGQTSPKSIRSTRRSLHSGHSSGYLSRSSKLALSKAESSSTITYDSRPFVLQSSGAVEGELHHLFDYDQAEAMMSEPDNRPVARWTKENQQLIELQQESQRDKGKIEELETELSLEHEKSEELIEERRRLQEELETDKSKIEELEGELSLEREKSGQLIVERRRLQEELETDKIKIEELENEVANEHSKSENLVEEQRRQKEELEEYKSKFEELEMKLSHEHKKFEDLVEERRRQEEELDEHKRKIDELEKKLVNEPKNPDHSVEGRKKQQDKLTEGNKVHYKDDPVLVKTIRTKAASDNSKGISGLATSDDELFITNFQTDDVEVYDLKNLNFTRSWKLEHLVNPWDMKYCNINKCLYIMDVTYINHPKRICRVDRNGNLITNWTTEMDSGCISVAYDGNVVMAGNKVTEYTADGQFVRHITLSAQAGFTGARYAIKQPSGLYLISHGEGDDTLNRVCVVDIAGENLLSFDGMSNPIYMNIDSSGSIFVVDCNNGRVLMLSSGLEFIRDLISSGKDGMHRPERMTFDEAYGRLVVAHNDVCWSECQVFVFRIL